MYCRNCGSEIAEGSKFCNQCGQPVEAQIQPESIKRDVHNEPAPELIMEEEPERRTAFAEFQWNTTDYPDRNVVEKTEDVDFNWNAAPEEIPDTPRRREIPVYETGYNNQTAPREEVLRGEDLEREVFGQVQPEKTPEEMSAAERIDKFYTFNRKNEEFQKLINNEYERVKSGNAIEHEMFEADRNAAQRFQSRPEDSSMEAFLAREGVVKPYQPKEFQSDVLQRIEAQEAEREAKRLEEEARLEAIEEARREAEARKRAEEEAQRKAAEEAARLEEIARRQAEEEARAAEEARVRAAEEARLKAEEENRRRVEEEARLRAEAEARVKAAEEARLKAEADLKAAQEAAKIRAQQEARIAAEAEAQFRAEQERKRLEAEEAQKQLEEKRRRLAQEANQAVAQEEVRKVLEQTARMRAEEEAKIKAAVAGLRSGGAQAPEINKEVEEAHQATRNQINEMAKARDAYFAEPEIQEPKKTTPDAPVTGRNTMLSASDEIAKTRVIDKAAIAAGLNEATRVASVKPAPAPADDEDFFNSLDAAAEGTIPEAVPETYAEPLPEELHEPQPMDFRKEEPKDEMDDLLSQFEAVNDFEEPVSESYMEGKDEYSGYDAHDVYAEKPGLNDTVFMPQEDALENAPANDFDSYGNEEAANYSRQQLAQEQAQAQYNGGFEQNAADDFYGDDFYADEEEEPLSRKEQKQRAKEQKRLEKERAKEEKATRKQEKRDYIEPDDYDDEGERKGGKGRVVLKVILVLLILILIVEVVGMGIRFLAPQSKAAEFIDEQINKVIQLITGDDTEYNVIAAQVRVEPMEDKTDLINAQRDMNFNNNIKSIVYSADLAYDQETDSAVTDLVLSTPMTEVEWGRDEDNYPVYYDEQVIGAIIAFESKKVELMNNGNEDVLSMIGSDAPLYSETAALKGQGMSGSFDKLEIGEIRQAGSNYYVWVRETIGDTITEKVYSMYPEKQFVMKMASCIVVE